MKIVFKENNPQDTHTTVTPGQSNSSHDKLEYREFLLCFSSLACLLKSTWEAGSQCLDMGLQADLPKSSYGLSFSDYGL